MGGARFSILTPCVMNMSGIKACVVDIALEMSFGDELFIMLYYLLSKKEEPRILAYCGMNSIEKHYNSLDISFKIKSNSTKQVKDFSECLVSTAVNRIKDTGNEELK